MKLYELPRNTYFTIDDDDSKEIFFLDHIDGMYSYCLDIDKNLCHFGASTEVTKHE
jgi:hypothetical protein